MSYRKVDEEEIEHCWKTFEEMDEPVYDALCQAVWERNDILFVRTEALVKNALRNTIGLTEDQTAQATSLFTTILAGTLFILDDTPRKTGLVN